MILALFVVGYVDKFGLMAQLEDLWAVSSRRALILAATVLCVPAVLLLRAMSRSRPPR